MLPSLSFVFLIVPLLVLIHANPIPLSGTSNSSQSVSNVPSDVAKFKIFTITLANPVPPPGVGELVLTNENPTPVIPTMPSLEKRTHSDRQGNKKPQVGRTVKGNHMNQRSPAQHHPRVAKRNDEKDLVTSVPGRSFENPHHSTNKNQQSITNENEINEDSLTKHMADTLEKRGFGGTTVDPFARTNWIMPYFGMANMNNWNNMWWNQQANNALQTSKRINAANFNRVRPEHRRNPELSPLDG